MSVIPHRSEIEFTTSVSLTAQQHESAQFATERQTSRVCTEILIITNITIYAKVGAYLIIE